MFTNGKIVVCKYIIESLRVKNTLGQNYQMFVTMRAKKTSWDKTAIFLSVWRQKNDLLFCSRLMFTNGKIVVCKYII
jgi:hypothetical protein